MLGYILIGGIALFGFFALKGSGPASGGVSRGPSSGNPDVERELDLATTAILAAYVTYNGCAGFDLTAVSNFQRAVNAYFLALGKPAPLHADGAYDAATDGYLKEISGHSYPQCVLTFEAAEAGGIAQVSAPAPGAFSTSFYSASDPGLISPTAGRSAIGRT